MVGLGESSLDFDLLVWVNHPSERGMITSELYVDIYQTLVREGFKIPFPQRDLWLREVPEGVAGNGTSRQDAATVMAQNPT
jgi:small-conductance mechanosensitive channel